ncbi:MAG: HEAT repeat domain-containing protein [Elusimicrobia bacterium]|nr:HEAT repeat domain-containing protein [Elusimicrobiota bacterium]
MRVFRNTLLSILTFILIWSALNVALYGQESDDEQAISPAVQVLLGKLFVPDERERIGAAIKLADYHDQYVVEGLMTAAKNDSSDMVKRVVLRSLGHIGDIRALPVILSSIETGSVGVKIEAMQAAVNFSTSSVKNAIMIQADSPNPMVRQKAVAFLGRVQPNDNGIIKIIIEKLSDISEGVRVSACAVVGSKKTQQAIEPLSKIIREDGADIVRKHAAMALGDIGGKKAQEVLVEALSDTSPMVRITAAQELALNGSRAGLNEAMEGIKSPEAWIRVAACEVIGETGDTSAKILLEQATQDIDRRVQKAAQNALMKMSERFEKKKK